MVVLLLLLHAYGYAVTTPSPASSSEIIQSTFFPAKKSFFVCHKETLEQRSYHFFVEGTFFFLKLWRSFLQKERVSEKMAGAKGIVDFVLKFETS